LPRARFFAQRRADFLNLLLGVDGYMMMLSAVTIFLLTIGLTGLGVGMGAIYPKFINENPAQIAMSVGGILYMIFSLLYIGVTIILEAWPVYVYFSQQLFPHHAHAIGGQGSGGLYLAYALVLGLSAAVTVIPLYLGVKRLQAYEIV
jgi:ABC-2 type transport system permease protein